MTDLKHRAPIENPQFVTNLLERTIFSWLWLVVRLYVGYEWLMAGWHKFGDPKWMSTGEALKGFWTNAVKTSPKPIVAFDWYRDFLNFLLAHNAYTWFAKIVVFAELAIGICLILGLLTGFAAFGGALLNFNFMMAGTASTNPVLFILAVLLVMAWKVAGYWGVDRWLLPLLGTPWHNKHGEARVKSA